MALGDPYATLPQFKARLSIQTQDIGDDPALTSYLSDASQIIEGYCGRQFNDAGAGNETARAYYPDTLTEVSVDDFQSSAGLVIAADYSNSRTYATIIAAANYQLEPLNGVYDGTPGWPFFRIRAIQTWLPIWYTSIGDPATSIQVTARWGWSAIPKPVTEACLIIAEELFKIRDAPWGIAGFDADRAVRVRENPKVASLLGRYQRRAILMA